jgi:hypothetical protein
MSDKKDMYQKIVSIFIISLFLYGVSNGLLQAEEWKLFYKTGIGEEYYFDNESITRPAKDVVRVWQKTMQRMSKDESVEKSRTYVEIYCRSRPLKFSVLEANQDGTETQKNQDPTGKETPLQKNSKLSNKIVEALKENICP